MQTCRMISMDTSTKKSAVAVFDNGTYISSQTIDLAKEKDMECRFSHMSAELWKILAESKPDIIYIEDTAVTKNAQTQRFLTRLQGVIYAYAMLHNCEFNTIRPTEWRKLVGIEQGRKKREALKQEAIEKIKTTMNLQVGDDEAEAILIGAAAIRRFE